MVTENHHHSVGVTECVLNFLQHRTGGLQRTGNQRLCRVTTLQSYGKQMEADFEKSALATENSLMRVGEAVPMSSSELT